MLEDLLRSVLGLAPGARQINQDLAHMRNHSRQSVDTLIPWFEEKEMELLSLNVQFQQNRKDRHNIAYGTVMSIYYEPMVTFAYKHFVKGQRDGLLYIRTKTMEFIYRLKRRDTDVYFNANPVAVLDEKGVMHGVKSKVALGAILSSSGDWFSIVIKGKEVGHMFNPSRPHNDQQRAFTIMANLEEEEEYILISLGLYELVARVLQNKRRK